MSQSEIEAGTLYSVANEVMIEIIEVYLELSKETNGFTAIKPPQLDSLEKKRIILGGINSNLDPHTSSAEIVVGEWERMSSIDFSAEEAVTKGVYAALASKVVGLLQALHKESKGFTSFTPDLISSHPEYLPIYQRLLNAPSKAKLKELVGSVSDNSISGPAAIRIADALALRNASRQPSIQEIQASMAPTLEGIVRDLVGRVLLESVVASALDGAGVDYKRENEYAGIEGVIYKFRADFVIPDAESPKVFIEVRKSSSRHASLYAKDKMFSAINWKGKNKDLMAILITEGPWTSQTLQVMTNVFDYVVPLRKAPQIAEIIAQYLAGDKSKMKLLITFEISKPSFTSGIQEP